MKILGIESSCDDTCAAVVEDGRRLLSNCIASSAQEQNLYGGVVPEIASRRHIENISGVAQSALDDAGLSMEDIDAVAVTFAPGLIGAVLVGVNFAKGLSYAAEKPLIPVHHLRGHVAALYLTNPELEPPFCAWWPAADTAHRLGGKLHQIQRCWGARWTTPRAKPSTKWPARWAWAIPAGRRSARLLWAETPRHTPAHTPCGRQIQRKFSGLRPRC